MDLAQRKEIWDALDASHRKLESREEEYPERVMEEYGVDLHALFDVAKEQMEGLFADAKKDPIPALGIQTSLVMAYMAGFFTMVELYYTGKVERVVIRPSSSS